MLAKGTKLTLSGSSSWNDEIEDVYIVDDEIFYELKQSGHWSEKALNQYGYALGHGKVSCDCIYCKEASK